MSNPKRKVTDLLPSEAILISSDADLKVLEEFERFRIRWRNGSLPTEWHPNIPCVFTRFNQYVKYGEEIRLTGLFWKSLEDAKKDNLSIVPAKDFIPTELDNFWKKLSEEKPHSYKTGHWDGKMSDTILFADLNGLFYVGKCYQGIMDGSEYIDFYDQNDFEVHNVTHWAKIPSLF